MPMPEKTKLLAVTDLPVGESRTVTTPAGAIAVFHRPEGFFALANQCPHRGGPLADGPVKDGEVACPWHQWSFRLSDGACSNIPGGRVKSYPVEIIDNEVWAQI